jgi:hypothetical protein
MLELPDDEGVGPISVKGRANTDSLGDLHGAVSEFLTLVITSGKASPAFIGAAITFLKNNNITADPARNAKLAELSNSLAERKRKGMTRAQVQEASEAFEGIMGGFPQ